jgi:hypothetical protein
MTTLKRATIRSYDAAGHRASVQVAGSLAVWLDGVPVATDIPASEIAAGRECAVVFFTDDNPDDAVLVTVHGAAPSPSPFTRIDDGDGDTSVETDQGGLDPDTILFNVAGTLRHTMRATSPHHELTGDARVSGKLDIGATGGTANLLNVRHDGSPVTTALRLADFGSSAAITLNATGALVHGVSSQPSIAGGGAGLSGLQVRGLNFFATCSGQGNFSEVRSVYARSALLGSPVVTDLAQLWAETPLTIGFTGSVSNSYVLYGGSPGFSGVGTAWGVRIRPITAGAERRPFWDEGSTTGDASGNRFRSNTQFGSTTGAFGGGDGVIGIANASAVPNANPAGGGVLYASGGALYWRGSAGTVTQVASA